METEKTMQSAIDLTLDMQIKGNPALASYKDVMKKFFTKHMSYASLKNDLIDIYAKEFTEPELKELVVFYRTPIGKKLVQKTPTLTKKAMELGQRRVQDNLEELKAMIGGKK